MKKLVLAIALFVVAFTANAQETKFGVKGGLNIANFVGDDIEDNSSLLGFHIGGYASIGISEKFAIQPEILYSAEGTKFEDSGVEVDWTANYLNIPVLAKIYATEGLSFHVGPQIGLLLSSEVADQDVKDQFKSTNLSAVLGLGYELESGINFGARYNLGLTGIADEDDVDVKTGTIQIFAGYSF